MLSEGRKDIDKSAQNLYCDANYDHENSDSTKHFKSKSF